LQIYKIPVLGEHPSTRGNLADLERVTSFIRTGSTVEFSLINNYKYTKFYVKRKTFNKYFMKLNRLKEVFDEFGVKNRTLAMILNKSESTISLWRNNKRQPSLEEFYIIAKLLRINIHELIEISSWENEDSPTYKEISKKNK